MSITKCVCCSTVTGNFSIFNTLCTTEDANTISLPTVLETMIGIDLPKAVKTIQICQKCSIKLIDFNDFRNMCLESVKSLKAEDLTPEIEPEILEYKDEENDGMPPKKKLKLENGLSDANLEGIFTCYICDDLFDTYDECKDHMSNHIFRTGVKTIKRMCKVCNTTPKDCYLKHIKKAHPEYQPNTCKHCGKGYQLIRHLQKHLLTHSKGEMLQCQGCSQQFSSPVTLKLHAARTKHSITDYHCLFCGLGSRTFSEFLLHATSHKNNRSYFPCFSCKNVFMRRSLFKDHYCSLSHPAVVDKAAMPSPVHRIQTSQSGPHKCNRCPSSFDNEDELLCHQHSLCTGTKKFTCKLCNIDFRTQVLLTSHTRNLHETRMFICDQCGHSAATKGALDMHQIVHRTERTWKCHKCSLAFKDRKGLQTHRLTHEPKSYECHLCGKFYRSLNTIEIHMKLRHIRPDNGYKCVICTKSFVEEVDRDRHLVTHRSTMASCEICQKQYSNKKSLRLHRQVEHENLRFECYVCHQVLSTRSILIAHLFLHRGFRPFACSVCEKAYLSRQRLRRHLKKHHNMTFDEKIHGYRETNENISKIVDGCAVRNGETLNEQQVADMMNMLPLSDELNLAPAEFPENLPNLNLNFYDVIF